MARPLRIEFACKPEPVAHFLTFLNAPPKFSAIRIIGKCLCQGRYVLNFPMRRTMSLLVPTREIKTDVHRPGVL
jgi:hypothetical protein